MVQSKGRAIVRKRPRDRGFAANADCRRRHARGVLIHRRITIGNAIARHRAALAGKRMRTARNGLHGRAARTTRVIAAVCGQAGSRPRCSRSIARRRRKKSAFTGVRHALRAAATGRKQAA
ncbi:hypothetical protein [Burkholderia thailandensis]|uniref:hypothetical protein n=1 Tax=Burkholderia thailandensis TaxID=57975 RepID=UPI001D024AB4|nr:hypothetical protein [Burkholderia thailandensis]MCZ2893550.1 hypothetical protein [Burkholderia thailandensis]